MAPGTHLLKTMDTPIGHLGATQTKRQGADCESLAKKSHQSVPGIPVWAEQSKVRPSDRVTSWSYRVAWGVK